VSSFSFIRFICSDQGFIRGAHMRSCSDNILMPGCGVPAKQHDVYDPLLWFDVPESVDTPILERSSTCVSSATTPLHSDRWSWQRHASSALSYAKNHPAETKEQAEAALEAASGLVAAARTAYRAANAEVVLALADATEGIFKNRCVGISVAVKCCCASTL
jgi:hypothetical protein